MEKPVNLIIFKAISLPYMRTNTQDNRTPQQRKEEYQKKLSELKHKESCRKARLKRKSKKK